MANKFSYLGALEVDVNQTKDYVLTQVLINNVSPTLIVKPAGEVNKPYWNALLKSQAQNVAKLRKGRMDAKTLEDNRDEDIILYSKYVIVGWKDVFDASGDLVKFSEENCEEFLRALPGDMADELRDYCGTVDNFRASASIDVKDKAKN